MFPDLCEITGINHTEKCDKQANQETYFVICAYNMLTVYPLQRYNRIIKWRWHNEMLDQFKQELTRQGKSQNTIDTYLRNINLFIKWIEESIGEPFDGKILEYDCLQYKSYLATVKKQSPNSVNTKLTAVQVYADFLHAVGKQEKIKVEKQKASISPKVEVLEKNELNKCRRFVMASGNKLNIAVFEMFLNTGIRESELVDLTLDDIPMTDRKGMVIIRNGKGGKYREVPLNDSVRKALKDYIEVRPTTQDNHLFIGQRGALTRNGVYKIIQKIGLQALKEDKLYPHLLRHQCFTTMNSCGIDIKTIAELAGHTSVELTARYYVNSSRVQKENAVDGLMF